MKKLFALSLLALLMSCTAQSQNNENATVEAAVERLRTAMVDADQIQLEALTADELSYGHSSGKVEDKVQFVQSLTSGTSDFVTMDLADQTVKVVGNTALVRHRLSGDINDNGKAGTVKLGVLLVWQKQGSDWKLLARQAYKL